VTHSEVSRTTDHLHNGEHRFIEELEPDHRVREEAKEKKTVREEKEKEPQKIHSEGTFADLNKLFKSLKTWTTAPKVSLIEIFIVYHLLTSQSMIKKIWQTTMGIFLKRVTCP
jgi:hypothetical protein